MKNKFQKKAEQTFVGIVAVVVIFGLGALGYSYAIQSRGDKALQDLVIFVVLFAFMFGLSLLAKWQITDKDSVNVEKKEKQVVRKSFWQKIMAKENVIVNRIIRLVFHFLPLYFTLVLIKIDLFIGFKVGIFIFAIFSYLLVELKYVFDRAIALGHKIRLKSNTAFWIYFFLSPFLILAGIFYVAYNLLLFYIHRFPVS